MAEKRNLKRRSFSYYMPVMDNSTQKVIGYLADISPRGFRLDCKQPLPTGKEYHLRMELTDAVASKAFMVVVAESKWCRPDELDPFVSNIGFELVNIAPEDATIFQRIVEKYSSGR